uniref:Complex I assembly factor TIMMDC1, mitochondrial n=1 Tax=Arion vulgaris TaxID=1028688 RepID=A0A0B6XZJ3_9EUPU
MNIGKDMHTSHASGKISENNVQRQFKISSILFPYQQSYCFPNCPQTVTEQLAPSAMFKTKFFSHFNVFPKIYALDASSSSNDNAKKVTETQTVTSVDTSRSEAWANVPYSIGMEELARAYIAKETGMDRVRALFQKDHKGDSSNEIFIIKVSLIQVGIVSFLLKYVPSWKLAREDFIRENNATVFRTNIEAARMFSDYASLRGLIDGFRFSSKVTFFSAIFLFASQIMAAYRNKTSVLDYTFAAGLAGGLARIHLGPKGMFAGSVVGVALGTFFGGIASVLLNTCGMGQETMHLQYTISRLEVERSIVGDSVYKQRLAELAVQMESTSSVS